MDIPMASRIYIFAILTIVTDFPSLIAGRALEEIGPGQGTAVAKLKFMDDLTRFRYPEADIRRRPDLSTEYYYHYDFSSEYDVPELPKGMTLEDVYAHAEKEMKKLQARAIVYMRKKGIPIPHSMYHSDSESN